MKQVGWLSTLAASPGYRDDWLVVLDDDRRHVGHTEVECLAWLEDIFGAVRLVRESNSTARILASVKTIHVLVTEANGGINVDLYHSEAALYSGIRKKLESLGIPSIDAAIKNKDDVAARLAFEDLERDEPLFQTFEKEVQ